MKIKTLILYGTRKGTTKKTCEVIAEELAQKYKHQVDVINVRQYKTIKKHLNDYQNIIIASSIISGHWVGKAQKILKKSGKLQQNLLVFVTAGGTMNKIAKYGYTKQEAIEEGIEKYIDKYLNKYKVQVLDKMVFGGRVVKKEKVKYDNWNKEDIEAWTTEIGKLIS